MADLAVGLSKTAVEILKKKFEDAVEEEEGMWQTVMKDFVFITDEFEMMQSFFNAADSECVKNNVVRTWVRQVHDLSYDAEDWIESVKHLDPNPGRLVWCRNILCRMIRSNCFCFRSCCEAGAAQSPDEAFARITLLKARIEEVRQRSLRYNILSEPAITEMQQASAAGKTRKSDVLIKATDDAADEPSGFLNLTWLINKESSKGLQVISVWGTEDDAGVVATIKEAYDDSEIRKNFRCAWVRFMGRFNPIEFMESVMAQFIRNSGQEQTRVEPKRLKARFVDLVNHKKYFIVLEEISSMEQWHAIRTCLPDYSNGSRIVVSTQHLDIARSCAGHRHQALEIKQFSDNHSVWALKGVQNDYNDLFVRRNSDEEELFSLLEISNSKKTTFGVYNVWGLAGVGKSVLVKTVYNRCLSERRSDYSECAWVDVPYPLNLLDFCKIILHKVSAGSQSSPEEAPDGPIRQCQRLLYKEKLLLVIDGVRSKEDWDLINSNFLIREPGSSGARKNFIIITTTVHIRAAVGNPESYYVRGLQEDAALVLFNQVLRKTTILRRDMLKEARRILPQCRGLPPVIIGMATHLASLFRGNRATREPEWKCLCANMTYLETVGTDHANGLHSRLEKMHSSFNSCPPPLKKFILYLLLFPENTAIRLRRLVRRWVALGLFVGTDSQSLEEEADEFIEKLAGADMSVIRAPRESSIAGEMMRMTSCELDPFVFRYFVSRLKEDCKVLPLEVSVLADVKQEETRDKTGRVGVHLAIRKEWRRDSSVFEQQLNLKRVRSLTVAGKWDKSFVSADRMSALRVLDLEDAPSITDDDLGDIGRLPPSLRFFSLRGCTGIRRLPDTLELGKVTHLQTLDIGGTNIDKLPGDIIKLRELEYVNAGCLKTMDNDDDDDGVKAPKGIKHLTTLKTLGVVDVRAAADTNGTGKAILKEIQSLQGLRKLKLSGIRRTDSSRLHKALACLTNLESLSLQLQKDDDSSRRRLPCWHDISPPPTVRSLKLHGHVQELPKNLAHLTRLSLEMTTMFSQAVIQALGSLPNLAALHLRVTRFEHGVLQFPAGVRFSQLRNLQITCHSILHVKFDKDTMEKVELVMVRTFPGSSLQFSGLQNLTSLKQFWLDGTCRSDDALSETLQKQLEKHAKKPALKMETAMWRNFWSI